MKTTLGGLAAWAEAVVRKHRMASAIRVELNIWGRLLRRQLKDWWGLQKEDVKGSRKGLCVQRSFDRLPTSKAKTPQKGGAIKISLSPGDLGGEPLHAGDQLR